MLHGSHISEIDKYLEECKSKSLFHKKQSKNSLNWYNLLGITSVILTSGSALSMTILSVYKTDELSVAVTSAIFSFLLVVNGRISQAYNFNTLAILHSQLSDDFQELVVNFNKLQVDYDHKLYEITTNRMISVNEKTHIQTVRECRYLTCCC